MEDGTSGDISDTAIEEEPGYGSRDNPMVTVVIDFASIYNYVNIYFAFTNPIEFHKIPSYYPHLLTPTSIFDDKCIIMNNKILTK